MAIPAPPRASALPLLLALVALNGVAVSTLYWAQALTGLAEQEFGLSRWTPLMPSATLAGYAGGVALLASVARDLTGPRGLWLHAFLLGGGLCTAAAAPGPLVLVLSSFVTGIGCALTQRVLACATSAVPPVRRGPVIGYVVASGLTGIVAARAAVPSLSAALGWRTILAVDAAVACCCGLLAALAARRCGAMPEQAGTEPLPTVVQLWRRLPVLRRAACQQAGVFAVFNFGWAIFPRMLAQAGIAGAVPMGAVAALGAIAALLAGWLCRIRSAGTVAGVGLLAVLLAGAGLLLAPAPDSAIYAAMSLLDVGTQTALVANQAQAQAQATSPAMRGRLAAIVTTVGFIGGAVGAALANPP